MLKTREEIEQYYKFDENHLSNEISKDFLQAKGARIQGAKNIEKSMKEDLSQESTKAKTGEDKIR